MAEEHRWLLKHPECRGGHCQSTGTEATIPEDTSEVITSEVTSKVTANHNRVKWVHNFSKTPLTDAQEKVLTHGPNFAVVSKEPPVSKDISEIERVCQQLKQGKAEVRGEIKLILKNIQLPKPNIAKEEARVIQELKKDKENLILTADKGVCMVVMDKEDYIKKSEDLLHQTAHKELTADPTTKYKNRLISLLKTIKAERGINNTTYKRLYPTGAGSLKYYGLPKIHKTGVLLRPIISSWGSATYETAKELAKILKPLGGRYPQHVQNNKDFLESIKNIKLKPDECIMAYDVSALFTSIPIEPAINIIEKHLKEDTDLHNRTSMTVQHIISLLKFCLNNSYLSFQGRSYEQSEELQWGLPLA